MKVGDLVKPVPSDGNVCYTNYPVVQEEWVGIIIDFEDKDHGSPAQPHCKAYPIVYWNPEFQAEVEFPEQIEVVQCKSDF